ncbi:hypothetical protein ABZ471_36985 [Streptomyces sp. NPDC005728]|uniref:hypothetical protein n=1 Tax=Streptomyces sp. NPDC005728 TaxID=3157054 RepID=UPI0034015480
MASIGTDRAITNVVHQQDNTWKFTVEYTAHFDPADRGVSFDDSVKIWEHDSGGPDQISAYAPTESFRAPQDGSPFHRVKTFTITQEQLSTEIGDEQTFAWIWLRRSGSQGAADAEESTPIWYVDD